MFNKISDKQPSERQIVKIIKTAIWKHGLFFATNGSRPLQDVEGWTELDDSSIRYYEPKEKRKYEKATDKENETKSKEIEI